MDIVICNASHAIVHSNKREKTPNSEFVIDPNKEVKVDHSKFGLFNVTAPNMNTYYPDVDEGDINPGEEDFIYPVFRLLSEVVVNKMFSPIDFRRNDVLKNSMHLLIGQTVYTEHEDIIGNHVGVVQDVFWQDAYTANGVKVPAGINGVIKIDAKANPKIARGILQDPPAIHSVSVSVLYQWDKSHDMPDDEFYGKLGTFDDKGNLVRKIVSDIVLYSETSLVPHGADPFAQLLNPEGKIHNTTWAKKFYSIGGDKFTAVDYKLLPKGNLEVEISKFNLNNPNKNKTNMDFLNSLAKLVGFEGEITESNQDKLKSHIDQLIKENLQNEQDYAKEINVLKAEKDKLQESLTERTDELTVLKENETFIKVGKNRLTELRDEAVNAYTLLKGENKDEKIINLIQRADLETVTSLLKDYKTDLEKLSPLTCQDCKSVNISRASAAEESTEGGENGQPKIRTNMEVVANRRKRHLSTKRLHGE